MAGFSSKWRNFGDRGSAWQNFWQNGVESSVPLGLTSISSIFRLRSSDGSVKSSVAQSSSNAVVKYLEVSAKTVSNSITEQSKPMLIPSVIKITTGANSAQLKSFGLAGTIKLAIPQILSKLNLSLADQVSKLSSSLITVKLNFKEDSQENKLFSSQNVVLNPTKSIVSPIKISVATSGTIAAEKYILLWAKIFAANFLSNLKETTSSTASSASQTAITNVSTTILLRSSELSTAIKSNLISGIIAQISSELFSAIKPSSIAEKVNVKSSELFSAIKSSFTAESVNVKSSEDYIKRNSSNLSNSLNENSALNSLKIATLFSITSNKANILTTYFKNSVVNLSSIRYIRDDSNYSKISSESANYFISVVANNSSIKQINNNYFIYLGEKSSNDGKKLIQIVISSSETFLQARSSLLGEKSSDQSIFSLDNAEILTGYEKVSVQDFLLSIGLNVDGKGLQFIEINTDCNCSCDLSVIPFEGRLANELINFDLCGGESRFGFETIDLQSGLKKRGLL